MFNFNYLGNICIKTCYLHTQYTYNLFLFILIFYLEYSLV